MTYPTNSQTVIYGTNYTSSTPTLSFTNISDVSYSIVSDISGVTVAPTTGVLTGIATTGNANFIKTSPSTQLITVRATNNDGLSITAPYTYNVSSPVVSYSGSSKTVNIGETVNSDEITLSNFVGNASNLTYSALTITPSTPAFSGITNNSSGLLQINTTRSVPTVPINGLDTSYNVSLTASYGSIFTRSLSYKFIINRPTFSYNSSPADITYGMNKTIDNPNLSSFTANMSYVSYYFYTDFSGITLNTDGELLVDTRKTTISTPLNTTTNLKVRARYGNYFDLSTAYVLNLSAPTISYLNSTMNFGQSIQNNISISNFDDVDNQIVYSLIGTNSDLSGTSVDTDGNFIIDTSIPSIKTLRTDYAGIKDFRVRALYGTLFDISNTFNITINAVDPSGMIYKQGNNTITSGSPFVATFGTNYTTNNKPKIVFTDTTGGAPLTFNITNRQKTS
jgi:hypothetical protein